MSYVAVVLKLFFHNKSGHIEIGYLDPQKCCSQQRVYHCSLCVLGTWSSSCSSLMSPGITSMYIHLGQNMLMGKKDWKNQYWRLIVNMLRGIEVVFVIALSVNILEASLSLWYMPLSSLSYGYCKQNLERQLC